MPENNTSSAPQNAPGDLVSLDDALHSPLESGSGASGQDTIINAAEMFNAQLEQMTAWKQKLGQQMDMMRKDGVKLLERQKVLAVEKTRIAEERTNLTSQREQILNLRTEVEAEAQRLAGRAAELEQTQARLTEFQVERERWERELVARQNGLTEREARALAEDVRLKEALEQLEGQRRQLADAHRQAVADQEAAAAHARELATRAEALNQHDQNLQGRENEARTAREQLEQTQSALRNHQEDLARREQALGEKIKHTETELQGRLAAAQQAEQHLAEERQAVAKARQELQRRLDAVEQDHAEQLDALSKQTKRLSERRAELENAEADLEKALAGRIAEATESLKQELSQNSESQQQRITQLEKQLQEAQSSANEWRSHESNLNNELAKANTTLKKLKDELQEASAMLERACGERSNLAQQLAEQIEQGKKEAARWQEAVEVARAQSTSAPDAKELDEARNELTAARKDVKALKARVAQLQTVKDDLEFQLEVRAEDAGKQLENLNAGLTREIAKRDQEIAEWKQKFQAAQKSGGSAAGNEEITRQLATLEQQRNDLASQLFAAQDALSSQQNEALLAKNALESKVVKLEQRNTTLEAEKSTWQAQRSKSGGSADHASLNQARSQAAGHRERLLRQAKALRNFRQQVRDTRTALETGREDLVVQREQIRSRKENLEQVKRLLEKQEMVMARKLADHNAIKTVAAIGIFVIMVLGSTFLGVYRFVHPTFRSETVVQLAVPPNTAGPELDAWLGKQMQFVRSNEVTFAAWKVLRSSDEHYGMHDVREEWVASLASNLNMQLDAGSKTLAIRYNGPDGEGVAQVCNALATAYTTPGVREGTEQTRTTGLGSQIVAKATVPLFPVEDNRLMISLTTVAGVLLFSMLFVIIFRRFVTRQLKEIDQMADAEDLADMQAELPEIAKPAEA